MTGRPEDVQVQVDVTQSSAVAESQIDALLDLLELVGDGPEPDKKASRPIRQAAREDGRDGPDDGQPSIHH